MPHNPRSNAPAHHADVPRPALEIWQPLESETIVWEGQVAIVGSEVDLPSRLVITRKRLALIANNEIALEFPRTWMRPEPKLTAENGIRLYITPDGHSQVSQPMLLRAREGRGAAIEIAAALTGRPIQSRSAESPMHIPVWKDRIGASPSIALPNLNDDALSSKRTKKVAAWPPTESAGVSKATAAVSTTPARPRPSAGIAPWKVGSDVPTPTPVPAGTSRAQRLLGTSDDGYTITESINAPTAVTPAPADRKRHMPVWLLNIAVVALLIAGFGYVAVDRGYGVNDLQSLVPGNVASMIGIDQDETPEAEVAQAPVQETAVATEEPVNTGGDNRLLPVRNTTEPTAPAQEPIVTTDSIGMEIGGARDLPVTASTSEDDSEVGDTESSPRIATEEATEPAEDVVATEAPIETEIATEAPVETEVATVAPVETEVATEAPVETEVATQEPTFDPTAPLEATEEPVVEPTTVPTPEPTVVPTQVVTLEQPASVAENTLPAQQFTSDGIRYTIDAVETGNTVPSLPQINAIGDTWVVITVTGANTGSDDATFDMNKMVILADGNPVNLDSGTAWVSSLLGYEPAYGATDTATWDAGEQHQFSLTYRVPAGTTSLALLAGDQQIDLSTSISTSTALTDVPKDVAPAATVSGTVTEVIDAQTIVVDVEGELITVRYLGIDAPVGESCYAEQARAANAELVEGQTVTLERQSADTTARGLWLRDVWVTDANGEQVLVSQALVQNGSATTKVSQPNSRYESWLTTSQNDARNNGEGMWNLCAID